MGNITLGKITNIMSADAPKAKDGKNAPSIPRVRKSSRNLQESRSDIKAIVFIVGALFVVFMLVAQYSISSQMPSIGNEANQSGDGLYYTMRISNSRVAGEPVMLMMSVTNTSGVTKTLDFSKDTQIDFIVQNKVNMFFNEIPVEVWRYSKTMNKSKINKNVKKSMTILPNEEKVFSVKWNQTDNNGENVQGGKYIITGEINTSKGSRNLKIG